jgi:hypothetical protein
MGRISCLASQTIMELSRIVRLDGKDGNNTKYGEILFGRV